jgi:hypothetical protein
LELPLINDIKITGQYTKLEKFSSTASSEGERYALDFDKTTGTLWEWRQLSLVNESSIKYREFLVSQIGSELYSFSTQMGLKNQFNDVFYTKLDIGYAETYGLINNYFGYNGDNDLTGFYAQNTWNYSGQTFKASASTKYNFQDKYAYPLTISSSWNPNVKAGMNFNTIYYWDVGPGQTDFSANYNPNQNWNISIGLGYNFLNPDSPWTSESFVARISNKINDKWSYNLSATYNYLMNDFSTAECNLIYDWHCRQIVFHYDGVEEKYWLQIIIKALPNSSLKLTGNDTIGSILSGIETE